MQKIIKTEQQWRELLGEQAYHIAREAGTEPAFSGQFNATDQQGIYHCRACGLALFSSEHKYDAGCGWPSFFVAIDTVRIERRDDFRGARQRVEVLCAQCDSHLGHVFDDGPQPSGERYCINSAILTFAAAKPDPS